MSESFNIEIISPEKKLLTDKINSATIPAFEGEMTILSNHIPIITFLRPGIIKVQKNDGNMDEFFVEDGTIEFFKNILVILSSSIKNTKNLSKSFLNDLEKETQNKLGSKDISDHEVYVLNHKLATLKQIGI